MGSKCSTSEKRSDVSHSDNSDKNIEPIHSNTSDAHRIIEESETLSDLSDAVKSLKLLPEQYVLKDPRSCTLRR